jgi:hypothetical protein
MTLAKSIYSHTTGKLYGSQFEPVMIISRHDNVLIVEGVNGRFPVHFDHVTDEVEQIEPEQERAKVKSMPAKKHKQAQKVTNTLFD